MKEFFRKKIVGLKRNTKIIPLLSLVIALLFFSLNLTSMSNTTAKIQGSNMGLAQFGIMLFSLLSLLCVLNAFPTRKKPVIPMVVLIFVMLGIIVFCDIHYLGCIDRALNAEDSSIAITASTQYIQTAKDMLHVHIILEIISAALVALLPVYSKLIRKINTSVKVDENENMGQLELEE